MKILGLAFGIISLIIAACVLLVATVPAAKVTIAAIRPTGQVVARTNIYGEVKTGPEWLFGITNIGRASASWITVISSRQITSQDHYYTLKPLVGLSGVLEPGEGVVKAGIVLTGDDREWSGRVHYQTVSTSVQRHLWDLRAGMPRLTHLLPARATNGFSQTCWYPATP